MDKPTTSKVRGASGESPLLERPKGLFWYACFFIPLGLVLYTAERGAISPSTRNPAGVGVPRPVEPMFPGMDIVFWGQTLAVIFAVGVIAGFIWGWRRYPRHPFLLMTLASTSVCWLDPINNWSIYLVYNPALWHFPQDWPWVGLSPIIDPLMNFIYAPFVLTPYLIAISILKRMQRKRAMDSFVWKRPLVSLAVITFLATLVWDSFQEIFLVATQFYTYTHIVPFGSIFVGEVYQFPLLMASGLIAVLTIPASVLMYRDDTGKTQAEKLAQRLRLFRTYPATTTLLTMIVTLNLAFMIFISCFYTVRVTGLATSVACPWPYPESVVFDPNGYYEREGQPGPYWEGRMNNWFAGQPDGRPTNIEKISDRCSPEAQADRRPP